MLNFKIMGEKALSRFFLLTENSYICISIKNYKEALEKGLQEALKLI